MVVVLLLLLLLLLLNEGVGGEGVRWLVAFVFILAVGIVMAAVVVMVVGVGHWQASWRSMGACIFEGAEPVVPGTAHDTRHRELSPAARLRRLSVYESMASAEH